MPVNVIPQTWEEIKSKLKEEGALNKEYDADLDSEIGVLLDRERGAFASHTRDSPASKEFFEHLLLLRGSRLIAGIYKPVLSTETTTSLSYQNIGPAITLPSMPLPAGMTAIIGFVAVLQNDASGEKTYARLKSVAGSRGTTDYFCEVHTSGGTDGEHLYKEVYVHDLMQGTARYKDFLSLRAEWKVTGGTGTFWPGSTIILMYEVI